MRAAHAAAGSPTNSPISSDLPDAQILEVLLLPCVPSPAAGFHNRFPPERPACSTGEVSSGMGRDNLRQRSLVNQERTTFMRRASAQLNQIQPLDNGPARRRSPMSEFCAACGKPMNSEARFCSHCGVANVTLPVAGASRAPDIAPQGVRPGSAPWGAPPGQTHVKQSDAKLSIWARVGIYVVVLLSIGALVVIVIRTPGNPSFSETASAKSDQQPPAGVAQQPAATGVNQQLPTSPTYTTSTPEETSTHITASDLWSEYDANEVLADRKYKGHLLLVTGVVDSIDKDFMDQPHVSLKGNDVIGTVRCSFSKDQEDVLMGLSKGQTVSVIGKCDGRLLGDPEISGCSVAR